jgi:hypothetical protein
MELRNIYMDTREREKERMRKNNRKVGEKSHNEEGL